MLNRTAIIQKKGVRNYNDLLELNLKQSIMQNDCDDKSKLESCSFLEFKSFVLKI